MHDSNAAHRNDPDQKTLLRTAQYQRRSEGACSVVARTTCFDLLNVVGEMEPSDFL